jgi:RNA polymerase sigma-70 factor (ECF subfamily)
MSMTNRLSPARRELPVDFEELSDAALMLFIARDDQAALAEVYERHAGAVFQLGRRLLGDPRAEELVQEVFLRLWHEPTRFDPGRGTLRAYLLTVAHGRAVDVLRSDTARREREHRDLQRAASQSADVAAEAGDFVVSTKVRSALRRLPAEQRTVIEVAYFHGCSYQEVAARLQLPEGTVKSRIRSGLRRLHEELVGAGVERGL